MAIDLYYFIVLLYLFLKTKHQLFWSPIYLKQGDCMLKSIFSTNQKGGLHTGIQNGGT